jgi:hypothetical protein
MHDHWMTVITPHLMVEKKLEKSESYVLAEAIAATALP